MRFDGLVCDLDGVVYRGEQAIPGAPEKVVALRAEGVPVVFCTNQSRLTIAQYLDVLERLGVPTEPADVLTSAVVTAEALARHPVEGETPSLHRRRVPPSPPLMRANAGT